MQKSLLNKSTILNDLNSKKELLKERNKYDKESSEVKKELTILEEQKLSITSSLSKTNLELEEIKRELLIAVQDGREIPKIPEIDFSLKDNISIEEMYQLTGGTVEYGRAKSIVKNMFYLSKSRQDAIKLSETLRQVLEDNSKYEDVIEYIANSCVNDVRHIEGTINRLLAYTAMMVPDKITLDFANEALNDYVNTNIFINNSISSIQSAVAEYFKISVDDLKSKRRTNTVVKPRHIAMYLCRVETDENLMKIGLEFGGRDHSTVSTACDKIKEELEKNPNLNNVIKDIKMKLQ